MLARIVVVHEAGEFLATVMAALGAVGHEVAAFTDPMAALKALETSRPVEVLITQVNFAAGKQNGVSLALMTRPRTGTLFLGAPEDEQHTVGVGELIPASAVAQDLVDRVARMLGVTATLSA